LIQATTGYIFLGRLDNARKSLDQLARVSLSDAQSIQVVSLLLSIHENDSAITLVERLNSGHSRAPAWAQFNLALAYLLAGNYEKAVAQALVNTETLRPAVSGSPGPAHAWSVMGIAYAHLKQGERSVNAFWQAANLAPGEEEHWLNLTRELMELNRPPEAIKAVQSGLAANPKSYALHLRLGAAYLAAGRYGEAESVFRDLVAAGDPLPTGYIGLAQVLLRTGRAEEAAAELGDAEKKLGSKFLISYFRGLALDRAGKPSEALLAFREAVELNSSSAEAHLNLGKMELAQGQVNEGIAELQQAFRLNPDDRQIPRLLSQAYRRAGDAKNAAKFAEAFTEAPISATADLVGDFIVPQWQAPAEGAEN
jgi:tetratricopeptide (TPR) repeat protein